MASDEEDILSALIGHIDEEEARENEAANQASCAKTPAQQMSTAKFAAPPSKTQAQQRLLARLPHPQTQKTLLQNVKVPERSIDPSLHRLNENFRPFTDSDQDNGHILGIRVTDRKVSRAELSLALFGRERNIIEFSNLVRLEEEDFDDVHAFGTVAVLSEVSDPITSAKTKRTFRYWTVTDLKGAEMRVVFFGDAYRSISGRGTVGSVVAIVDPRFESRRPWDTDRAENSLIVYKSMQITVIGTCPVFARCRDPDCVRACDTSISPYCAQHAKEQLRVLAANRMALNSSGGAFNLINNPHQQMPATRREARRLIRGLGSHASMIDEEEKEKVETKRPEDAPVARVDARAYMSEVMQGLKNLSAAHLKVAQALKLVSENQKKNSASTLAIPTAPAVQPRTAQSTAAQMPRPLGSGLVLKRHARDVKLAQDIAKRIRPQ